MELAARMITATHPNTAWQGILTPRQAEVLELVSQGHGNKEIADRLFFSAGTVKSHLHDIYTTLEVRNRVEAARWWIYAVEIP